MKQLNAEARARIEELEKEIREIKEGKRNCSSCGQYHKPGDCPALRSRRDDRWADNF